MPLIIPIGIANVRHVFRLSGVTDEMGFSMAVVPDPGMTAADVALSTFADYNNEVWDLGGAAGNVYSFQGTVVTLMTVTGPVVAQAIAPVAGTLTAFHPPPNLSMLINKNTAAGGRKNRGRLFHPTALIFENEVDHAGQITSSAVGANQTKFTAWLAALDTSGTSAILLHSDPADVPTPITSLTVQSLCATQRRRMR